MITAVNPIVIKSAKLSTGVTVPYVEQGDPAGIPVILLHGVTDSWRSFEPMLPYLPQSLRVFTLTQRGHGDADKPASGYAFEDFSSDVAAFMDHLGLESLLAKIPNARLEVYVGGGHAIHWEDPKRVATDLVAFIESNIAKE